MRDGGVRRHRVQHSGIPEAIPLEMCYLDRQASLRPLTRLVQPALPA